MAANREVWRRLLAALADATPAFEAAPVEPGPKWWRRLLAALADATPAFTPGARRDEYSPHLQAPPVPAVPGASSGGMVDASQGGVAVGHGPTADMSLKEYASRFAALPVETRLGARVWFPQEEMAALRTAIGVIATLRKRSYPSSRDMNFTQIPSKDAPLDLDLNLAIARAFAVARAITTDFARDFTHGLDLILHDRDVPSRRDLAVIRARNLASVLDHAKALTRDFTRDLDSGLADDLEFDRAKPLVRALLNGLRSGNARALGQLSGVANDLARILDRALDRVLDTARKHALDVATAGLRAYALVYARDRAYSLADNVTRSHVLDESELQAALEQLDRALNDLTGADLADANLDAIPLDGVLWSSRTRWPGHMEEAIRRNSVRIGPDLYQVGPRWTSADNPADLTV